MCKRELHWIPLPCGSVGLCVCVCVCVFATPRSLNATSDKPNLRRRIFSDVTDPINGIMLEESCNILLSLRPSSMPHKQHMQNATNLANASVAVGHIDPPPLIPIFTR